LCDAKHILASCVPTLNKCQHFIIQRKCFGAPFNCTSVCL
jgi:hypothetical protein